jgi:hypothetical protein
MSYERDLFSRAPWLSELGRFVGSPTRLLRCHADAALEVGSVRGETTPVQWQSQARPGCPRPQFQTSVKRAMISEERHEHLSHVEKPKLAGAIVMLFERVQLTNRDLVVML